jgi:hypothetical protein
MRIKLSIVYLFLFISIIMFGCAHADGITPTQEPSATVLHPTDTPYPTTEVDMELKTVDFGGKAVYTQLHFEDFENSDLLPGFELSNYGDAVVTGNPDQVIAGDFSVRLSRYGHLKTNADVLPLEGNTTYLVEFDYIILDRGNQDEDIMFFIIQPAGEKSEIQDLWISTFDMLRNAEEQGTFTVGGKTGDEPIYTLSINSSENTSIVIDDIRVFRQDVETIDHQPEHWMNFSSLPYPRLGGAMLGTTNWIAHGIGGEPPFSYSVNQIERRMAMLDVLVGLEIYSQTIDPGFTYRLRKMNPNIIISPYRIAQEQNYELPLTPLYKNATEDMKYDFLLGLADEWFVRDINGDLVGDPGWVTIQKMNISEFCPIVSGQTFNDYLIDWILDDVMAKGHWDGIHFDNLFGDINPHIPNRWDPALLDFDYNLNGLRDETPAMISEMTRKAAISLLERLREEVGDLEIITGNTGPHPDIYLAPFVNGYLFECINEAWDSEWIPGVSEAGWRLILQEYFIMQAENVSPVINIIEGCGRTGSFIEPDRVYLEPTEKDLQSHRFAMGTALLSDGFYEYDLYDSRSAPYWFDEYTVSQEGVAEEAPENKGYLGHALGEAVELKSPGKIVWEQDFEFRVMPAELRSDSGIYISQDPENVIDGSSSLVLDNPDHSRWSSISTSTNTSMVTFTPGETYVVEFDWHIIESLDLELWSYIWNGIDEVPHYPLPGVITGDSGRAYFPITLRDNGQFRLTFQLIGGGGKVAIDNIRVTQGGAGPWRRDFENGFVLVNPLNKPYTFTMDELSGDLERSGIKRILGTQSPEVNNGQSVVDNLVLQPFDAIILLADHIPRQ